MSLPLDDERLKHMASAMGEPNRLQQFRHMTTDELAVQMMRNTSIAESETPEMMGRRFVETSRRYKEDNEKERSLPPTKAPPLRKEDMIGDLDSLRSFVESENKQRDLQLAQTYLGLPLEFSTTPVVDLKPILLSEMMIRKTHKGRFLVCRVIARPSRLNAITMGVEDPQGTPSRLSVYNYPTLLDGTTHDLDVIFPLGAILLVREPTYKVVYTSNSPVICVDSPSDVIVLEEDDGFLNDVQWQCSISNVPNVPNSADHWRARGASEFKAQRWLAAAICYTKGLKLATNQDLQVLRLNRAETYLRLGWYISSLHDTEHALRLGTISDTMLSRKATIRLIKANYGLGRYERVVEISEEHADDDDCKDWRVKAKKRIAEQTHGSFDWFELLADGEKPNARPDVAEYRGPVEVRECKGEPGVRGVFATRDVKIGELLMVAKPLASGLPSDTIHDPGRFLAFNFLTNKIFKLTQYLVVVRLVQRLWDDTRANSILRTMYAGPSLECMPYPAVIEEERPLEHPLKPKNDIDIARIEAAVSMNSFGLQDVSLSVHVNDPKSTNDDSGTALYELPSFCNHSCLPTANQVQAGDVMIVRATQDLKTGDEITFSYVSTDLPFAERSEKLKAKWKFTCDCKLCRADREDGLSVYQERVRLCEKAESVVYSGDSKRTLSPEDCHAQVEKIVRAIEKTYDDSIDRRNRPVKSELFVAACALTDAAVNGVIAKRLSTDRIAEAEMVAMESTGIVIRDKAIRSLSRSNDMPIDQTRSYCAAPYHHRCIHGCLFIAKTIRARGNTVRSKAWVDAAKWIFSVNVADDSKLFVQRYAEVLRKVGAQKFL